MTGPKIGWLAGGICSLCWLPLMALIWLWQGGVLYPLLAFVVFIIGILYVWFYAPWRHPHRPIWLIYLGMLGMIAAAVVVAFLGWRETAKFDHWLFLPGFFVFVLPFFSFGHKTWSEIEPPSR